MQQVLTAHKMIPAAPTTTMTRTATKTWTTKVLTMTTIPMPRSPYHDDDPYAESSGPNQSQSEEAPQDQPAPMRAHLPQALQSIRGYGTPLADTPDSRAAAAGQQPSADRVLELQQQIQRPRAAVSVADALNSAPASSRRLLSMVLKLRGLMWVALPGSLLAHRLRPSSRRSRKQQVKPLLIEEG